VVRTRVGYAGGTTENPTYHNLGDHSETIQIEYDPTKITYEELLAVFWNNHNPTARPLSRQYASIVFYHDEAQREVAERTKAQEEAKRQREIYTEIVPAGTFYPAEAYHQKYWLRGSALMREFGAMYPDGDGFAASTATARANGYLGGNGTCEQLQVELKDLGLSSAGQEELEQIVCSSR
jgi:peptide-methionine (S)-S-oxide reductase